MGSCASSGVVRPEDVADILENLAALMASFHKSDVALQDALSALATAAGGQTTMFELQHIDLLTQSHFDLSKLLTALAPCLRGTPVRRDDLKDVLTLRSLQDSLIDPAAEDKDVTAGEVALF